MHDKFMKTAFEFAAESKCVSYHVGAVIVKNKRIVSIGYNGTPPDTPNCCDVFDKDNFDREAHHHWSKENEIHAEMNAVMFAAKEGESIKGCDIYVTTQPCNDCLKNLSMTGIKNLYYLYPYDKEEMNPAILKVIKVQQVPGADEIKEWVEKNELNYVPRQRKIQEDLNNPDKRRFNGIIYKVITELAEITTTEYFIRRPLDGKVFRVFTPFYEKDLGKEIEGHLTEQNDELVFKVDR